MWQSVMPHTIGMKIYEAIHKPLDAKEKELMYYINNSSRTLYDKWCYELILDNEPLKAVWYNKEGDKYGVEYGYSLSTLGWLVVFMQRMKIKNICDLGCGAGLAFYPFQQFANGINFYGYDNEQILLDVAASIFGKNLFKYKDITKLVKKDLMDRSLIYFYEPIYEKSLCTTFINNLCDIINPKQLVYCRNTNSVTGFSYDLLKERSDMEFIDYADGGAFFKKKK